MAERTWEHTRDAVLSAVRKASRLPFPEQHVNWYEDCEGASGYAQEPNITLQITSTSSEGQRRTGDQIASIDPPGFTDQSVGISHVVSFTVSIRVQAIGNARSADAMIYVERIRAWLYEPASPEIAEDLFAVGVAMVDSCLSLAQVSEYTVDERLVKVWVLDTAWRAELFLESTERTSTIASGSFEGKLDDDGVDPPAVTILETIP